MKYPKISLVTINLNQAEYLEETIQSVLNQGYPNLEYIIIDGNSTDGSVDVIKRYESQLAYWISEEDDGHVYALQKGFEKATGDIMGWINSDDKLHHRALFSIAEIFEQLPVVKWFMGFPTWFNGEGLPLVEMKPTPSVKRFGFNSPHHYFKWARWSKHRFYNNDFHTIQQESTFWRRELWEKAGGKINTEYKLAFDMELWCRFFRHEKLFTADVILAGFRHSAGTQQSLEHNAAYLDECRRAVAAELKRLGKADKVNTKARYFAALLFKPGYYLELPFCSKCYGGFLKLPAWIKYNFADNRYELRL